MNPSVGAFLAQHRNEIIDTWYQKICARPRARLVGRKLVINNFPQILDAIFVALGAENAFDAVEGLDPAAEEEHGQTRFDLGYRLEELAEEFNSLREAMLERLDAAGLRLDRKAARALHSAVDRAHRLSVGRFIELQQDTLRERQSSFLARLAHDFRTPLGVVLGSMQLLRRTVSPAQLSLVERAERATRRILLLIESQLATEAALAGELIPNAEPFDLAQVLGDAVELVRPRAEGKGLALRLEVTGRLHCVSDPALVGQVIQNLVDNAVKYTEAGSIVVRGERRGDQIVLEVEDTGRGMPKEILATVFKMYERSEYGSPGRGIGLAVVKEVLGALGGSVFVQSEEHHGTRFTVKLPVELHRRVSAETGPAHAP